MRYAAGHKQATKTRLLQTGGAVVKKHGFATTGVDSLMEAVGLTGGAFYSHFSSKSELLAALIVRELGLGREMLTKPEDQPFEKWLAQALDRYLGYEHVKHPETGCPIPTLSAEVARSTKSVKQVYERELTRTKNEIAKRIGEDAAWAAIAQCVGAILISRAMASETGRKRVLVSSKKFLKATLLELKDTKQKSKK